MTTRIDACFAELKKQDRSAFITFLMAGDPDPATSLEITALPKAGADIIEIGMPFTDPMADGPRSSGGIAGAEGRHDPEETLALVRAFRAGDNTTPLVLMAITIDLHLRRRQVLVDANPRGRRPVIVDCRRRRYRMCLPR